MSDEIDSYIKQINNETDFFSKAKLIHFLIDKKGQRIVDVAKKLGIKSSYVCHILRLNKIPDLVVDGYYSKLVSLSHLFIISRLKDQEKMIQIYEVILSNGLTVLQTEEKVRDILHNIKTEGIYINEEKRNQIIDSIQKKYPNAIVKIFQTRIKSSFKIEVKGSLSITSKIMQEIAESLKQ